MSDASSKAVIKSHRDLIIWQKAMDLVVAVYHACKNYPKDETYGLISQTRRAAVSIPANIAEGPAAGEGVRAVPGKRQRIIAGIRYTPRTRGTTRLPKLCAILSSASK